MILGEFTQYRFILNKSSCYKNEKFSYHNMKLQLKVDIPEKLSAIKLEQYQKYLDVLKNVGEDTDSNFTNLKALEIFCGLKLKDSYKIPIGTFEAVLKQLNTCLNEDTPLIKRFWFRGSNGTEVEYGFIPDLHEMSFGEYVDLDTFISDWKNMHKAMAVLFRPIVSKKNDLYQIEEYESALKYADYMKHMPANVALGAMVFFYRLGMKLSNHITDSTLNEMNLSERTQVEKMFLDKNGVGINQFTQSLEEMSQSLTKLPERAFISV